MKNSVPFRVACGALLVCVLLPAASCSRGDDTGRDEIVVAAAASLTDAFEEMGRRFTARTGVRVTNSFASTGSLARQIENGAPFDVFAAADVKHVEALEAGGLLAAGSMAVYARGRLVVWLPGSAGGAVARLEDLAGPSVGRIAIAKPELAPYGEAAVESLRAAGLWDRVEPKVVYAEDVSQARQFAATGNADAAFVPYSLVKRAGGRIVAVEGRLHRPPEHALAVVGATRRESAARRFAEFVLSAEGKEILAAHGYEVTPAGAP